MNVGTLHALERAAERYGLNLDWAALGVLKAKCRLRDGLRQHGCPMQGTEVWLINHFGTEISVVYDRSRDKVITLAPWAGREMFRLGERVRVTDHGRPVPISALMAQVQGGAHAGA